MDHTVLPITGELEVSECIRLPLEFIAIVPSSILKSLTLSFR